MAKKNVILTPNAPKEKKLKCIRCGCLDSAEKPVTMRKNPLAAELWDDYKDYPICDECTIELHDDV